MRWNVGLLLVCLCVAPLEAAAQFGPKIAISRTPEVLKFLPTHRGTVSVEITFSRSRAIIVDASSSERFVNLVVLLHETTRLEGVACNYKTGDRSIDDGYDLQFAPTQPSAFIRSVSPQEIRLNTSLINDFTEVGPLTLIFRLVSFDFGGRTTVVAVDQGRFAAGPAGDVLRLPIDDDNNGLPDEYERVLLERHPERTRLASSADDSDMDGIPAGQESRGFMILDIDTRQEQHLRLDWYRKDLFFADQNRLVDSVVHDKLIALGLTPRFVDHRPTPERYRENKEGLGRLRASAAKLFTIAAINASDDLRSSGIVNFSVHDLRTGPPPSAPLSGQHLIYIQRVAFVPPGRVRAATVPLFGYGLPLFLNSPEPVLIGEANIKVNLTNKGEFTEERLRAFRRATTLHEILHRLTLRHTFAIIRITRVIPRKAKDNTLPDDVSVAILQSADRTAVSILVDVHGRFFKSTYDFYDRPDRYGDEISPEFPFFGILWSRDRDTEGAKAIGRVGLFLKKDGEFAATAISKIDPIWRLHAQLVMFERHERKALVIDSAELAFISQGDRMLLMGFTPYTGNVMDATRADLFPQLGLAHPKDAGNPGSILMSRVRLTMERPPADDEYPDKFRNLAERIAATPFPK